MKKTIFVVLCLMLVTPAMAANFESLTLEWVNQVGGFAGNPSFVTYNPATDHFLICDYSNKTVKIANGTDGSLTGGTLSMTGLNFGTGLGVFAVCVAEDGTIYGGIDAGADGTAGVFSLAIWANESATPTQQDPTTSAGVPMQFPRAMDVVGTGTNTVVGVTGNGSGPYIVTFLTTTNGTDFDVSEATIDSTSISMQIKQGVALVPSEPLEKVYGVKADGAGTLCCLVNEPTWEAVLNYEVATDGWVFAASRSYVVPPAGLGAACVIGYSELCDVVFVLGNMDAANDYITAIDGTTGEILQQVQIGQNVGTFGYGAIDIDDSIKTGYIGCRSGTASNAIMGKFTFETLSTPTPTFTPAPTSTPSSGINSFEIYK
jgi:hypothetical protein